jgi:redox-sensitive bicupin YhaK (pirin superfamily)
MLQLRPRNLLDHAELSWLKARYHFIVSAGGNPDHSPLGPLIVWNDDEIAPGTGFGQHRHADMEIITYVRQGAVTHEDSQGNVGLTYAGDVQVMSAGSGIYHAERNTGDTPLRMFQIWITPRTRGGAPRWGTRSFPRLDRTGRLTPLASGMPDDTGALYIDADARVLGATLSAGDILIHQLEPGHRVYLAPSAGSIVVNGQIVRTGDGLAVTDEQLLTIVAEEAAELVLVEVA